MHGAGATLQERPAHSARQGVYQPRALTGEERHRVREIRDEGAGTIVKSGKKMIWGHKASIIGLPEQGIAIDAVAVSDAATHDGQTFFPHVQKVLGDHPDLAQSIQRVLYDSACDDAALKQRFEDELGIELKASFNPRRSKAITEQLPRDMEKITPYGVPICLAGHEMDYQGIRYASEKFIYRAPQGDDGLCVCIGCRERAQCCNRSTSSARTITVSFDTLNISTTAIRPWPNDSRRL